MPVRFFALCAACAIVAWALPLRAADGAGHTESVSALVLALAVILLAAKLGGDLAMRAGQPAVLGELLVGVLLGNLPLIGLTSFEHWKRDPSLEMLAQLGVIILLFEVGLESTVAQMLRVGWSSLLVAGLGVAVPFGLGWLVSAWLMPDGSHFVHMFIGAALTATSVGITARVLQDLGRAQSREARIILGAAVIDDVLGLVVLAVVADLITAADRGTVLSAGAVLLTLAKAFAFLLGALVLGVRLSPRLFALGSHSRARGMLLALGLAACFSLAWLASAVGLAPIVGAFAAGLVLESVHYRSFVERGEHGLEQLIQPISAFLVPVFFVLMGMHTELRAFVQPGVLTLALALIVAAVIGKQACYLGVLGRGLDRFSVGIGMIPRGEVGLIFANIGLSLTVRGERIVDSSTYSALVLMVIVTTMITPPALKWSLERGARRRKREPEPSAQGPV